MRSDSYLLLIFFMKEMFVKHIKILTYAIMYIIM